MKIYFNLLISVALISIFFINPASAKHLNNEKYYQDKFCKEVNGITEFYLLDKTRIDCLTDQYAIEFDFAPKYYEAIGQSLYYSIKTGKQAGIVLIIENPTKDNKYLERLKQVSAKYNIKVWTVP